MANLLPENKDLYTRARQVVVDHPSPNTLTLVEHFGISWIQAKNLAEALEDNGHWPRCGHRQGNKRVCTLGRGHTRGHLFDV